MKGIAHCEFVPPNSAVNSVFYCDVWDVWEKVCDKQATPHFQETVFEQKLVLYSG
jgi:hypothetical protein